MSPERLQPRLRPAEAGDAPFLAWGLDEAADGLFRQMLGRESRRILTELVTQPRHAFSYQHATVAEIDGRAAGFCQGFPHGTPSGDIELAKLAGLRTVRAIVVAIAILPVVTALTRRTPGQWYLQAIAVTPESRSRGVGNFLFKDAFDRARASGCQTLALDVEGGNVRARELYERLGLVVTSTSRRAFVATGGSVRVHRMSTAL